MYLCISFCQFSPCHGPNMFGSAHLAQRKHRRLSKLRIFKHINSQSPKIINSKMTPSEDPIEEKNIHKQLCQMVEEALHHQMASPKDFERLSEDIFARTRTMVSATTLKRIWGYIRYDYEPNVSTLDALAQFVGYLNYSTFCQQLPLTDGVPSNTVLSRHINVLKDLSEHDEITLYWAPNRRCLIHYLGNQKFVVKESEYTRLLPGDTFICGLIIEGEPLYLNHLVQTGYPPTNYVCGKKGGIRFDDQKHRP